MISFNFRTWNVVLDKLISIYKKNGKKNSTINLSQGEFRYKLNTVRKSLHIENESQSITIRNQKFVNPEQRGIVKKLKNLHVY